MKRLAAVSAAQLCLGVTGRRRALRDRIAYDVGFRRGAAENMESDQWFRGTALSAPNFMLILQGVCTALLLVRPRRWVARVLGVLGTVMICGQAAERPARAAWCHWDARIAPLTAAATVLAAVMTWWGLVGGPIED
ncbi:hypothetical protein [Kocuria sabuli]|uniref:hypothetical protein n=1 Tax=Kocuria sabuli TaxID=3071448 RepID=UPI0034D5E9E2